jgi:hypothetical protein
MNPFDILKCSNGTNAETACITATMLSAIHIPSLDVPGCIKGVAK